MTNIPEIRLKGKASLRRTAGEWAIPAIVAVVGILAFALGRFSVVEDPGGLIDLGQATTPAPFGASE